MAEESVGLSQRSSASLTAQSQGSAGSGTNSVSHSAGGWAILPFRFRDQVFFAFICLTALISMVAYCARTSHWGAEDIELQRQARQAYDYKIELNSATWVEWSQLPGIGPVLGQRIVAERERRGPFRDLSELKRVRGIGDGKLEAIRPYVRVDTVSGSR